jgi:predicted phage terminase large subunit-like protein
MSKRHASRTARIARVNDALKAAREFLLPFTLFTKRDYRPNWHHERLAEMLDQVANGDCRRLMVFMPPQHGKSELVSRRFPAFLLGMNPKLRLMQATHTNDLAIHLNRDVQRIMAGREYRRLFPGTILHGGTGGAAPAEAAVPARRTNDYFEIPGHGGCLLSVGVGNSIAGSAADGAIIDDPFGKREDADSPAIREKIWQWYANDLYPRLSAKGWIVVTHTRWHRDDLAGRLLRKMADRDADRWEVLCLSAIKEEDGSEEASRQGEGEMGRWGDAAVLASPTVPVSPSPHLPVSPSRLPVLQDRRRPGEALWPDFKSVEDLEIIRRQDARAFAALYQQNPTDGAAVEWAAQFFGDWMWVPPEKWPKKFALRMVCIDPSKGGGDGAGDYCAIVFVGGNGDGRFFVDAVIDRFPLDQIVRKTILMCDQTQPQLVGIEADQFQELLIHEFRRQVAGRSSLSWRVVAMRSKGVPKVSRIRRLSQYIVNREFRFKADSPGCRLLVDQLMDFPHAEHDDGPDALEMCMRMPSEVVI